MSGSGPERPQELQDLQIPVSNSFRATVSRIGGGEASEEAVAMAVAALGISNADEAEVRLAQPCLKKAHTRFTTDCQ